MRSRSKPSVYGESSFAMPVGDRFVRIFAEMRVLAAGGDVCPRCRIVQHQLDVFPGLRQRRVDCRRERIDPLGPAWIRHPERARAFDAEVALTLRPAAALLPGLDEARPIDGDARATSHLQRASVAHD